MEHKSQSSIITVGNILSSLENEYEQINLDPLYQRDVVWDLHKSSNFIDSVVRGIVPNNLIFNREEDSSQTCIDGKQRITSLQRYKNNEISVCINGEDVYFNKLPDDVQNARIMTNKERNIFSGRPLSTIIYENLSYSDQNDIFQRLQNGVALTSGELTLSLVPNNAHIFGIVCDKYENKFKKFMTQTKRKCHHKFTSDLIYLTKNNLESLDKRKVDPFIRKLDNEKDKMQKLLKEIDDFYKFIFDDKLLNHPTIKSMKQNELMTIMYGTYKHLPECKKMDKSHLRKMLIDIIGKYKHNSLQDKKKSTFQQLYSVYLTTYDIYNSKGNDIEESSDDMYNNKIENESLEEYSEEYSEELSSDMNNKSVIQNFINTNIVVSKRKNKISKIYDKFIKTTDCNGSIEEFTKYLNETYNVIDEEYVNAKINK